MFDLLETRCSVWFTICCIAPWRYDWTHLHDRYDKSDFSSSDIISFWSCFCGILAKLRRQYYLKFPEKYFFLFIIFRLGLFGSTHGPGCKNAPCSLTIICHTYRTMINIARLYLTEQRFKIYRNHVRHPLNFADISIFHQKSITIAISRNTDKDCILIHNCQFF